jgi:hypothetical protein
VQISPLLVYLMPAQSCTLPVQIHAGVAIWAGSFFGYKNRPHNRRGKKPKRLQHILDQSAYDLTVFKLHFGPMTLKLYDKDPRVLRMEAIAHKSLFALTTSCQIKGPKGLKPSKFAERLILKKEKKE